MSTPTSNALLYSKITASCLFWGGTFIAGRVLSANLPPHISATLRFIIAAVLLIVIVLYQYKSFPKIDLKQQFFLFIMGLSGICLYNLFFFEALANMPAGRTALFVCLSPVLTVILAAFLFKEKLRKINYLGGLLAFIGTLIVVTKGHLATIFAEAIGYGEIMMILAVFSWVTYTLTARKSRSPALITTTYSTLWGTLLLALYSLFFIPDWQAAHFRLFDYVALLYFGAIGTVLAFIWYAQGIQKIGAARTVIFTNLVPFFAVALSFILLDEPIYPSMLIGGAISFVGVLLTNKR